MEAIYFIAPACVYQWQFFKIISTATFISQVLTMYIAFEKSLKQECHLFLVMNVVYLIVDSGSF